MWFLVFVFHYKWTWKWNCTERFKCVISKFQQWWRQTATSSLLLLSTTSGHSSRRPVLRQWRHDNQLLLQWIRHLLPYETWHCTWSVSFIHNIIGLVQERRNYSALAMELRLTIYLVVYSLHHNVLPTLQSIPLMTNGPLYPITQDSSCHGQHTMPRNPWSFPMTSSA